MQWCRFERAGLPCTGVLRDGHVYLVEGSPFSEHRITDQHFSPDDITWLPPVIPPTFYSAGVNYRAHILKAQSLGSTMAKWPEKPEIGYRAQSALIGHRHSIVKPFDYVGRFEAEPELVAVIGKRLRNCSREEALEGIFGWTIGNDVSARAWQYADRTLWRSKNSDTFCPMGPLITTDVDPMRSTTRVMKNGVLAAEFATGDMLFDAADYIVAAARYISFHPGDVIWLGSDGNVEMAPGDTIEISIDGVGSLCNTVVEEPLR